MGTLRVSLLRFLPAAVLVGVDSYANGPDQKRPKQLQRRTLVPQYHEEIKRSRDRIKRFMVEAGIPGLSVVVSVNGHLVWKDGFGYADVENLTSCHGDTLMRIASISKPITTVLAAKCLQEGKLDLDKPIQHYVPTFPEKDFQGEKVVITPRLLVSHMSGIRHYDKKLKGNDNNNNNQDSSNANNKNEPICVKCKEKLNKSEFAAEEYMNTKEYKSVSEALEMFKNDPLLAKPGSKYIYTTHGFTLLSAVIESAAGRKFPDLLTDLFRQLGMTNTFLDENRPLIANRSKYYQRSDKTHKLINVPEVNNSYKWAGGGILSNVTDLLRFANCLLVSAQFDGNSDGQKVGGGAQPFLKTEVVKQLWSPVVSDDSFHSHIGPKAYGMGWVVHAGTEEFAGVPHQPEFYSHSGGAIGASSILVVCPSPSNNSAEANGSRPIPCGVAVVILANLQECGMTKLGYQVAQEFLQHLSAHQQ